MLLTLKLIQMAKFISKSVEVNAPLAEVHNYLQNMANIQRLLPLDKISNWSNTEDSCSFKIQNVYTIELKRTSAVLNENDAETIFETTDKSPFPFVLKAKLKSNGTTTTAHQDCDATINPFMEMMVKGPFQQLFDYMSERLAKEFL